MSKLNFKGKWVLVTGASSGLGYELAVQLATQHGANLILLARRREKLEALKAKLEKENGVEVKVIAADLADLEQVNRALSEILTNYPLYAAILNAGVTYFGPNAELPWQGFQNMLQTNVVSVVSITNKLVAHFEQNGNEGGLLLVSSLAALFPIPYQAAYSGTKSFLLSFATALAFELKNERFSISVYAPGGMETEMTETDKFDDLKRWLMPVNEAAKEALYGFVNRKAVYIPGFFNRVGSAFLKLLPKRFITKRMSVMYQRSLSKAQNTPSSLNNKL